MERASYGYMYFVLNTYHSVIYVQRIIYMVVDLKVLVEILHVRREREIHRQISDLFGYDPRRFPHRSLGQVLVPPKAGLPGR